MFVAEAAVSSIFDLVLEKLVAAAAAPLSEYARRQNVEATLQEWRRILLHIEAVLTDAEQKQIRERAVKLWLDDLKSLVYDMEDVLDEFNTEANLQIVIPGPQASTSKGVGGLSFEMEERLQTTSLVDESSIYGRDAKKEAIIQFLLSEKASRDNGDNGVSVVPIVGMGGVGKTTLAQIIYHDKRVESHFDTRIWVCVSDRFDVTGITKAILESVTHSSTDSKNLESLQNSLKNGLNGKKFFLVLDDVWNEKPQNWDALKAPFRAGAQGSMIIVTTRNEDVASIMRTTASSHHLDVLSYEECRLLFEKHAFAHMNTNNRQKLEPIGEKIVRKCRGLPLAAKSLGSLLHTKQDENAWNEVLNNGIWDFQIEQSDILPALYLSYHYLPTNLKRCFAYCSIFPKDYNLKKELSAVMDGRRLIRVETSSNMTAFVVGEDRGAKIKELRDMSHLGGRLCISKLQNVVDAMDVFEANLKGKERLDELVMQWDDEATARDLQKETTVLEKLQPHNNLKKLTIEYYW
ncbi:putative disease resistance RPP13-like protein 1 [Vitis vinifera]|uniref:Putative disease resistance RPP13-like protein 1 n=1 Tax=Vitis vinifera TaxID=29760 RepID=A0A438IUH8_VITVI|nr:putative disease resistance RPP13-like protein 1 [Vitis vinifera]